MNPIIKAQLKQFTENNPILGTDESQAFEVMSIHAVENGLLGENIDSFDIHLKGCEFGLDGVAITIQGELCTEPSQAIELLSTGKNHSIEFHFFQSKTSESFDYGNISKFLDGVTDFFVNGELIKSEQIEDLLEIKNIALSTNNKSNPKLKCFYCTTGPGRIEKPIKTLIDARKEQLEDLNIFSSIEIILLGAKDIQEGFRSATNTITKTIAFEKSITLPSHPNVQEAHMGYISAEQFLNLVTNDPGENENRQILRTVFYDNVRDFNPESEINKSIIEEINQGIHDSFIFKNNGITVLARELTRKSDHFTLSDYQIINGCQTTNILYHTREHASKINIPLRIVVSSDADFTASIIIGNNKQNPVREDQFLALLPFMKDLEEYCVSQEGDKKIYIERRDNQFREIQLEKARIVKPSDLMKVSAAIYFHQPHRAARDHRGIRKEFSEKIFQPSHNVELYHLASLANYKLDYITKQKALKTNAIFKYYILFSISKRLWPTPDILSTKPNKTKKFISEFTRIILDPEELKKEIEETSEKINELIVDRQSKSREQIRDHIRKEAFLESFIKKTLNKPLSPA